MATLSKPQNDAAKAEKKFQEILSKFDDAMLVTHGAGAGLHARPMAIADKADGSLWFISGGDTPKIDELARDSTVMAVMQSARQFLTVSGRAELSRDRAKIAQIWKESYRAWFSGKDDPNIVLIRLNPIEAEYWDNTGLAGLKFALDFAHAYATGQKMSTASDDDPKLHGKVPL